MPCPKPRGGNEAASQETPIFRLHRAVALASCSFQALAVQDADAPMTSSDYASIPELVQSAGYAGATHDSIIDKNSWVKFTSFASVQSFAISSHRAKRWGS